ncbi:MAG: nitrile hydratase subunit alpha [Chlamydiota bacterium]
MTKHHSEPNRAHWEIEINLRAWKDPEFKKRLLKNPRETLEHLGCKSGLHPQTVKIIEEPEGVQIVVLHKAPVNIDGLSEQELRDIAAAGGAPGRTGSYMCN